MRAAIRKLAPRQRAILAAAWLDGRSVLIPTAETASQVFDVSKPLIADKRDRSFPFALGLLTRGWHEATAAERAAFVNQFEDEVRAALETVTAKVAP